MSGIANKKVLVTGSSRGIGKAIVQQLAKEGAEIVVHYRNNKEEAEAVVASLQKQAPVHLLQADLGDVQQAIRLGEQAWEIMNGIDYLVNNAGVCYKKHFLDTTEEDVDYFVNINYKGTLFLTQTVARKMVAAKTEGSIYTITSINGLQPGVGLSAYGATKGALETLMKGVALELGPHNIKVNTLAVGAVQTDMSAGAWQDPGLLKLVTDNIPVGRFGQPEEIAAIVCGLLSSASYMTGATITIDGGWVLRQGYSKPAPYGK